MKEILTGRTVSHSPDLPFSQGRDNAKNSAQPELTIKDVYPELSAEEQKVAEENLERYLEVVMRIFERINSSPGLLTDMKREPKIEGEN